MDHATRRRGKDSRAAGTDAPQRGSYESVLIGAVGCFLLAAAAGVLLRFALTGVPLPEWLEFGNLRRAHSHLMLSGWATPVAMGVMASFARPRRSVGITLWASLTLAIFAFPSFALFGYGPAELGSARVPLSVILSTLSMFTWYAFAALWRTLRAEVAERTSRQTVLCWDAALLMLTVGSLGAWGRGALTGLKVADKFLEAAVIELFLTAYVEGFLLLATLGLLFVGQPRSRRATAGVHLMVLGTLTEFLAFLPVHVVPESLRWLGAVGVAVASAGAILVAWSLPRGPVGALLAVLAAAKLLLLSPEAAAEVMGLGLPIPYLHLLLLGLVTPAFLTAALRVRGAWAVALHASIWLSLVALLPTTGLWPAAFDRSAALVATAAAAALAPLVVLAYSVALALPMWTVSPQPQATVAQ